MSAIVSNRAAEALDGIHEENFGKPTDLAAPRCVGLLKRLTQRDAGRGGFLARAGPWRLAL